MGRALLFWATCLLLALGTEPLREFLNPRRQSLDLLLLAENHVAQFRISAFQESDSCLNTLECLIIHREESSRFPV
jgi:hypothetical protein